MLFAGTVGAGDILLPQADGGVLQLTQPARRLITLSPHLAELTYAAGAGGYLQATVDYSAFPEEARNLPRVGDAFRLDLERILQFGPDLVLAWDSGNPRQAVVRLRELGLPVWSIEIRQPEEIALTLEAIGRAAGTEVEAGAAAQRVRRDLARLDAPAGERAVTYFYQVSARPLFTINGQHLIAQTLRRCGGTNLFAALAPLAPQVTHEAVIAGNPEVMFAPQSPGQPDPFADWRQWPALAAVAYARLVTLDADQISQATPRMLQAALAACSTLALARRQAPG